MDSDSQRQLAALRQRRAERQREATSSSCAPPCTSAATRLGRTVEAAAAQQQQRSRMRAAAAERTGPVSTFREQMCSLSKNTATWAERTGALGAGITAALSDQRAATAEWTRRFAELASVQDEVAGARSELDAQERKLAAAAMEVDTALQSDTPVTWLQGSSNLESGRRTTAAIVCTLRGAPRSCVRTFISHHLQLGFAHIYLFFDDPADPVIDVTRAVDPSSVTTLVRNAELELEQRNCCSLYSEVRHVLQTEIMARQRLNCETAAQRATAAGFHWLLHIDIDEAFNLRLPDGLAQDADTLGLSPVEAHFGSLDPSLAHVAYLNHEAVPEEVAPDPGGSDSGGDYNYFDQVTLFRRNPHCIPGFWATQMHLYNQMLGEIGSETEAATDTHQRGSKVVTNDDDLHDDLSCASMSGAANSHHGAIKDCPGTGDSLKNAIQFWVRRTVQQLGAPSYFLAYVNGKSAVRLQTPPLGSGMPIVGTAQRSWPVPSTVHRWEGQKKKCSYFDPAVACLLHYVNCGLDAFRLKYEMLAECTTSDWFHALPLYPRARAAAADDKAATDDRSRVADGASVINAKIGSSDVQQSKAYTSKIEALYRDVVVLEDSAVVASQLDAGVCVRYSLRN